MNQPQSSHSDPNFAGEPVHALTIRSYQDEDHADVIRLYETGYLAGAVAANDTGADIEYMRDAYFDSDRHHFWIATGDGKVLGMIGVGSDDDHTAEVRRLRVDPAYQHTDVAAQLLQIAIDHCKHHGYLKVRFDTRFEKEDAVDMFDRVGFQHTRTRNRTEKELLEFYLDIYREHQPEDEQNG